MTETNIASTLLDTCPGVAAAHGLAGIAMTLCQAFPELLELYPTDALILVADEIAGLVQVTFPSVTGQGQGQVSATCW